MSTPLERYPDLAEAIGISDLYFKREDLSPYGSHKGRSIPVMIEMYRNQGDIRFAISSSGNAALAAAIEIKKINGADTVQPKESPLELDIFVGTGIAPHKLEKLMKYADDHIRILKKERPLQALTLAMNEGYRSLRQSTDDLALKGYATLAEEISIIKNAGAIFVGTSSGTTAQALASYFLEKGRASSAKGAKVPQIHIVQTSSCHPIADTLNPYDGPTEDSIADAITDITAYRKDALVPLITNTGGSAWTATNEDIETARLLVQKHADLDISTNSALSVVGAMQARYAGHTINGPVICLICGE
jgi:threonine synthase